MSYFPLSAAGDGMCFGAEIQDAADCRVEQSVPK